MNNTLPASIYTIDGHIVTSVCAPQPLPAELQPFWDFLSVRTEQKGYAWAKLPYLMASWGVARWKVYEILNKLRDFGRLVAQDVKGSHERRFYLFSLPSPRRKSNENQTKKADSLYSIESATQKEQVTSKPAPVSAALKESERETVQQLVSLGVWPRTAAWLARTFPDRIPRAIAYLDAMRKAKGNIRDQGAYLKNCIVHNHGEGLDIAQVGKTLPPDPGRRREPVRCPIVPPPSPSGVRPMERLAALQARRAG